MDVGLGDLRYKIPKGQTRDLLSRTARLSIEDIEKSRANGSIARRLKSGVLIEVKTNVKTPVVKKEISKKAVHFPRQKKTSIVLDIEELDEQLSNMMIEEDEELLKELQEEDYMSEAPLVQKDD
jgi:hypothetical protein